MMTLELNVEPGEVADLFRLCAFTMEEAETSMVAFVDPRFVNGISRDCERLREVRGLVESMLERLPPEPPLTPEAERKIGAVVGAVFDKRFGEGSQQAVDEAMRRWSEG